jgi:phage repressor protein C with HTH and peptisase S24 domain
MKDNERLNQLLEALGENLHSLAKKLDINAANLYHIKNGRNKISQHLASLIASRYDKVNPEWLVKGKGEMYLTSGNDNLLLNSNTYTITMATGDYEFGDISIDEHTEKYRLPGISEGFLTRVRDDSMSPLYRAGDMISARMTAPTDPVIWGKCYIVLTGRIGFIRKLMPAASDDSILMVSINLAYPEFIVKKESIIKLAKITGVLHLE